MCVISVTNRKIKMLCLQDGRMASVANSTELNDDTVSVRSRTIRKILSHVGIECKISRKKTLFQFTPT